MKELKRITPNGTSLFSPLGLHKYENMISKAVLGTDLGRLRVTPHSARHGGASTAALLKILKIKEIQRCGRWLAPKSVRRYEKSGKLTHQVAMMPKSTVEHGARLLSSTELSTLVSAELRKFNKLRKEEMEA